MSVVEPGSGSSNVIQRIKDILLKPAATWDVIDHEPATIADLYKNWVVPLAAIPAVCYLIGSLVFGYGVLGVTYKPPILSAVAGAVVYYAIMLAGVGVLALIIDGLAPTFGGVKNQVQAFKVAAYSGTAGWLAGVFQILPALAILGILGLYSLYLLYLGLPRLMKAPDHKALPYTAVIIVIGVVITVVALAVAAPISHMGMGAGPFAGGDRGKLAGQLTIPGAGSVDIGKLEAASKQMELAAKQMENGAAVEGAVQPTDPELLKAYLPASVAGYARSEVSSSSGGVGGMTGSTAEAIYAKGDAKITLSVVDLGAAGAFAAMAGAFNVQSSSEKAGKYEKMGKVDGRTTMEEYDQSSGHGEYSVLAGDRFMIQAEGQGASIDELKAAVAAVNPGRLEGLAKKG